MQGKEIEEKIKEIDFMDMQILNFEFSTFNSGT